jgi:hypothetical protein
VIEILNRWTSDVIYRAEGAATIAEAVKAAASAGADLRGANLGGADLRGANLRSAGLRCADLRCADLRGADLGGADLRGADLRGANLRGANLRSADMRGANLGGADLGGADMRGAIGFSKYLASPLHMLRDQVGPIRAYKLVAADGSSPISSEIGYAPIAYRIGDEVAEPGANADEQENCGAGINLASLDWCLRAWRPGRRILIVEFVAEDIAAIPILSDGKFRVRRCKVVAEKSLSDCGEGPWSEKSDELQAGASAA